MECSPDSGNFFCFNNHWDDVGKVTVEQVENCGDFISKIPAEQLAEIAKRRAEKKAIILSESVTELTEEQKELRRQRSLEIEQEEEQKKDFSFKRFAGELQRQFDTSYEKYIPYPVEYKVAKDVLHRIFLMECDKKGEKMDYTDENTMVIRKLLSYFTGIKDPTDDEILSHRKGIYLYGDTGCGKSLIMRCMSKLCNTMETAFKDARVPFTSRKFQTVECEQIIDQVAIDKETDSMAKYYGDIFCFEDFGVKDKIKNYGNETPVMSKIMLRRGNSFDRSNLITHTTSNISFKKLSDKETIDLDERMIGRFTAMFHPIFLDGQNYRKKQTAL